MSIGEKPPLPKTRKLPLKAPPTKTPAPVDAAQENLPKTAIPNIVWILGGGAIALIGLLLAGAGLGAILYLKGGSNPPAAPAVANKQSANTTTDVVSDKISLRYTVKKVNGNGSLPIDRGGSYYEVVIVAKGDLRDEDKFVLALKGEGGVDETIMAVEAKYMTRGERSAKRHIALCDVGLGPYSLVLLKDGDKVECRKSIKLP